MATIQDLAHSLARALKDSPEHQAFQAVRSRVRADRGAEQLITAFRQQQFQVAALQAQGHKPSPEHMKQLEALSRQVQGQPLLREYLQAEAKFGQLWSEVQQVLCAAVGMAGPNQR